MAEKVLKKLISYPHGPTRVSYENDFLNDTDITDFTATTSGTGAAVASAASDYLGGAVTLTCGTDDNGYAQIMLETEVIQLAAGREIWASAKFLSGAEVTQNEIYFGLVGGSNTTSPIGDASNANPGSDYFLAYNADGGLTWQIIRAKDASTFTTNSNGYTAIDGSGTSNTIVAATEYDLALRIKVNPKDVGTLDALEFYIDGVRVAAGYNLTTDVCDDELMTIVFGNKAGAASAASIHTLDHISFDFNR